jgi:cytochrome P450
METRAAQDAQVKTFEDIPIIRYPDNYYEVLPTLLAQAAQTYGPVVRRPTPEPMRDRLGDWLIYLIGPEANRFVLQTHRDHFSHELGWTPALTPIMDKGLLNTDDPDHAWQRKMMNPAFAQAYMSMYLPLMQRIVEDRTGDWAERGEVDLYTESRRITFDVAAEALVGFQSGGEVDRIRELFFQLLHGDPGLTETYEEFVSRIMTARAELDERLLRLIAQRRRSPTNDILGLLVSARGEEGRAFTDRELLGQVHILLVAGHETTTTMNAWLLYLLAGHPDYLRRVHGELDEVLDEREGQTDIRSLRSMKVLGNAVDEAGRLYPPVALVPRGVIKEFEFNGYRVPAGLQLRLALAASHRLPHLFRDPDRFDPDRYAPPREEAKRNPYALVPFGGGPRICIGMTFAQVEIKVAAAHVLRRYTLEPITDRPPRHLYYGLIAEVPDGIPVQVHPRTSCR